MSTWKDRLTRLLGKASSESRVDLEKVLSIHLRCEALMKEKVFELQEQAGKPQGLPRG